MKRKQQRQPQKPSSTNDPQRRPSPTHPPSETYQHPQPRNEQERRQFAEADRRDRALLWTDDRPFSIYKS